MPLVTDDIEQARRAYSALEARLGIAEQRVAQGQAAIADLLDRAPAFTVDIGRLRKRILQLEAANQQLQQQIDQLRQLQTDASLQNFIGALGMAAALGEAAMPGRAVTSLSAALQAFLVPGPNDVAIRFQPPEFSGVAAGLSTTSFDIVKVPPAVDAPAPPNLYLVLQDKQQNYTDPFWTHLAPSTQIVAECTKLLADTSHWSFASLLQSATTTAALEKSLVALLPAGAPPELSAGYAAAVDALELVATTLAGKSSPVVGDLLTLVAALDATTRAARRLLP